MPDGTGDASGESYGTTRIPGGTPSPVRVSREVIDRACASLDDEIDRFTSELAAEFRRIAAALPPGK